MAVVPELAIDMRPRGGRKSVLFPFAFRRLLPSVADFQGGGLKENESLIALVICNILFLPVRRLLPSVADFQGGGLKENESLIALVASGSRSFL